MVRYKLITSLPVGRKQVLYPCVRIPYGWRCGDYADDMMVFDSKEEALKFLRGESGTAEPLTEKDEKRLEKAKKHK